MKMFKCFKESFIKFTALSLSVVCMNSVVFATPNTNNGAYTATSLALDIINDSSCYRNVDNSKVVKGSFNVYIDGVNVDLKNPILVYNGSSFLPLRELGDILNANVYWDDVNRVAKLEIFKDGELPTFIELPINYNKLSVEGLFTTEVALDANTTSFIDSNSGLTYIPLRTASDCLAGVGIIYYSDTNVISLTTDGSYPVDPTI